MFWAGQGSLRASQFATSRSHQRDIDDVWICDEELVKKVQDAKENSLAFELGDDEEQRYAVKENKAQILVETRSLARSKRSRP